MSRCAKPISSDSDIEIQENDFLESFKVNALGLVNVVHAFLPLVRKGSVKKVVNLSTGMADLDLIHKTELAIGAPYAASKAAANVVVAKYAAALKEEGILFLSMSPGYVSTEANLEGKNNH
jgi:NAD(P)-dependent dehydrogenase (short-subunit alcohol dehydrogenase family)